MKVISVCCAVAFAFLFAGTFSGLFHMPTLPTERPSLVALRGKDLACWCPLDQPCHADVLLELANVEARG